MEEPCETMRSRSKKRLVWLGVGVTILVLSYYAFSVRREEPQQSKKPGVAPAKGDKEWEHSEINPFLHNRPKPAIQEVNKELIELKKQKQDTKDTIDKLAKVEEEESGIFNKLKAYIKNKNKEDDMMKIFPSLEEKQKEFERQSRKLLDKFEDESPRLKEREDIQKVEKATKKPVLENDMDDYVDDVKQSLMDEIKALEGFNKLSEKHKTELERLRGLVKSMEDSTTPADVTDTNTSTSNATESGNVVKEKNTTLPGEGSTLQGGETKKVEKKKTHEPIYNAVDGVDIKDVYEPNEDFHKCVSLRVEGEPIICINSPHLDRPISSTLFRTGMWERNLLGAFMGLLRRCPDCHAIDLGANLGVYTLSAAALGRQVLALEPLPVAVYHLHKSVQLNGFYRQVILVQNALGEAKGVAELLFAHPTGNFGAAHTRQLNLTGLLGTDWNKSDRKAVRTITLDQLSLVPRFSKAVLKMDIQGAEDLALRHSDHFFQRLDIPYIITHWAISMDTSENCKNMAAALRGNGYVPYDNADGKELTEKDLESNHDYVVWVKRKEVNVGDLVLRN